MSVKNKNAVRKEIKNADRAGAYARSVAKTVFSNVGFYFMLAMDIACLVIMLCGGYVLGLLVLFCIALGLEVAAALLLLPKPVLQVGVVGKNILYMAVCAIPPVLVFFMGVVLSASGSVGSSNAALAVYGFLAAVRAVAYVATFVLSRLGTVCGGIAVLAPLLAVCFVGGVSVSAEYPLGNRPLSFSYVEANAYHDGGFMVTDIFDGVRDNVRIPETFHGMPVVGVRCGGNVKAQTLDFPTSVTYVEIYSSYVRNVTVRAPGAYVAIATGQSKGPDTLTFTSEDALPQSLKISSVVPEIYVAASLVDEALKSDAMAVVRDAVRPLVREGERYAVLHTDCALPEAQGMEGYFENTRIVSANEAVTLPAPELHGKGGREYVFMGWYTSRAYTDRVKAVPAGENAVLFAKYLKLYTVSFYDDEGEEYEDLALGYHAESGAVTLPAAVTKEGYAFCGWFGFSDFYTRKGEDTRWVGNGQTGDRAFKAEFKKVYDITWHLNGADVVPENLPQTYHAWSDTIELARDGARKNGYTFMGWFTDEDFTYACNRLPGSYSCNLDIYLKFNKNYAITYDYNGGVPVSAPSYYHAESGTVLLPSSCARTGYRFTGWQDETGKVVTQVPTGSTGDKHFTAQWTPVTYFIRYKSSEDSSSSVAGPTFTYDGTDNALTATWQYTRTGYRFTGWRIGTDIYKVTDGQDYIFVHKNYASEQDAVVYAVAEWEPITYTVRYESGCEEGDPNVSGSTPADVFTYNGAKKLRECGYTRIGYEFIGWRYNGYTYAGGESVATDFTSTQDDVIVFTAQWQALSYSVEYTMEKNGSVMSFTRTYLYDKAFVLPESNMRPKGYECTGWKVKDTVYPIDGTSRAYNFATSANETRVAAEAVWTPVTYTVAFYDNVAGSGTPFITQTFTYDAESTLPSSCDAQQTGHTFFGWNVATRQSGDGYTKNERHAAGKTAVFNFTDIKSVTIKATPAFDPVTYTVEFYESEEEGAPLLYTATFTYGAYNDVPACMHTREGYTFVEWVVPQGNGQSAVLPAGRQSTWALCDTEGGVVKAYGRWQKNDE